MYPQQRLFVLSSLTAFVLFGCVMPQSEAPPAPARTGNISVPVVTITDAAKQSQEKDGIRISVAPYPFSTKQTVRHEYRRLPSLLIVNQQFPGEVRDLPIHQLTPSTIHFKVKINNNLERIIRLAGTVVVFQVGGKNLPVDKAGYQDFLNGIILPRQEVEFEVAGPAASGIPDNTPMALLLYDMVTETDQAGNPTKRSNFDWFFTISREQKPVDLTVSTHQIMFDHATAESIAARDRGVSGTWVRLPEKP